MRASLIAFRWERSLRNCLIEGAHNLQARLVSAGYEADTWVAAQKTLLRSQSDSIDDFLKRWAEHATIMKSAVALVLNAIENLDTLLYQRNPDHWYKYLLQEALSDDPALGSGQLTVVTFNYDLSFEIYALTTLLWRHRLNLDKAREVMAKLRISHIYGHLGPIEDLHVSGRPYRVAADPKWPRAIENQIATCYETGSRDAVTEARRQINESELVIFLGFGYSRENLERLDLKHSLKADAAVIGSAFGIPTVRTRIEPFLRSPTDFQPVSNPDGTAVATSLLQKILVAGAAI